MPDPRELRVGDLVRFESLPEEWSKPGYRIHEESIEFLRTLIARRRASRVCRIDAQGYPWIEARIRERDGSMSYHEWGIYEYTGWRLVRRAPRKRDADPS